MTMPDAANLEGAISGRALYDGRIDPAEALGFSVSTARTPSRQSREQRKTGS
jgi:phosphoribosylformimino-5-aminoimidazole carboxamide ribotide isomerase